MEVRVAAPAGKVDGTFLAGLIEAFHAAHLRTFGYNYAGSRKSTWSISASPASG